MASQPKKENMEVQKNDPADLGESGHLSRSGPINELPTELLVLILEFVAQDPKYRYDHCVSQYHRDTLRILMLVCRRFRTIAQDFNIHTVKLTWLPMGGIRIIDTESWDNRVHLYRNPSKCRQLVLTWRHWPMQKLWFRKMEKTRQLVKSMHRVRCFQFEEVSYDIEIEDPWNVKSVYKRKFRAAWDVFQYAVQHFDRLRHLIIKRAHLETLIPACRDLPPSLRILDLIEVQERGPPLVLDPKDHRTASFTTLRIFNYSGQRSSLHQILEWPKALEVFVWGNPRDKIFSTPQDFRTWSIPVLERSLVPQKETLKLIHMGHVNFNHEGPALLGSWILPRVELFEYMLDPLKKGYDWHVEVESPFHSYMKRFSEKGRYVTAVTSEELPRLENE